MWQGSFYHTKTAHGDRLVGWHVNAPDPGGRPEFYQLQQYEKIFHKPDLIEKLIADAGSRPGAYESPWREPRSHRVHEVRTGPGRDHTRPHRRAADGFPVTINVRPRGNNPDLLPEPRRVVVKRLLARIVAQR